MPKNPPKGMPRITTYLLYEDAAAALDWLARAFGFREVLRMTQPDGDVNHAEMALAEGRFMLGQPGGDYRSPRRSGERCSLVHVYVDDVDVHFERARAAGATIVEGLADQSYGDRRYIAEDLEGQQWTFAQHVRDIPSGQWGSLETGAAGTT